MAPLLRDCAARPIRDSAIQMAPFLRECAARPVRRRCELSQRGPERVSKFSFFAGAPYNAYKTVGRAQCFSVEALSVEALSGGQPAELVPHKQCL
jgi:hypothetical protein